MYGFNAEFYAKPDGTEPAKEFMNGLDEKMFAKLNRSIDVLKAGGLF